jgi:hypothetical protein
MKQSTPEADISRSQQKYWLSSIHRTGNATPPCEQVVFVDEIPALKINLNALPQVRFFRRSCG